MAKFYNVTIKGTGYLNGNVNINKTVQLEDVVARNFGGSNRDEAILELCRQYYPGVKVEKGRVSANIVPIKDNTEKKEKVLKEDNSSQTKENSFKKHNSENAIHKTSSNDSLLKTAGNFAIGSIANSIMGEINNEIEEKKELKKEINHYKSKREQLIYSDLPKEKTELFNFANSLVAELKSGGWSDGEDHKNDFANACLAKLEQCKVGLIALGAINESNYLDKEISSLKKKKLLQKYLYVGIAILFIGVMFILYLLGIIHD